MRFAVLPAAVTGDGFQRNSGSDGVPAPRPHGTPPAILMATQKTESRA